MKERVEITIFIFFAFLFKLLFATDCGFPGIPKNGQVNGSSSVPHGATYPSGEKVIFACQGENRKVIGDGVRTCTSDGTWSGTRPWCGTNIAYKKRVRVAISTPNDEEVIEIPELTDGLFNNVQDSVCLPIHNGSEYALYFQMGGGPVHFLMLYVEGSLPDVDDFKIRGPENWTLKKTTKVFSNSSLVVVSLENGNLEEIGELSVNVTSTTTSAICEAELYAQEDPLECGQPEGVANGDVDIEDDEHMLIAGYTCHGGYQMYGNEERHCSNTEWIGRPPVCVPTTASSVAVENQTETPETTVGTPLITSENCDENDATNSRPASTKFPLLTPTESPDTDQSTGKMEESNKSETQVSNTESLPVSTTASVTEKDLDAHVSGTTGASFIAAFVAVSIVAAIALVLVVYLWRTVRRLRSRLMLLKDLSFGLDNAQHWMHRMLSRSGGNEFKHNSKINWV